MSGTGSEENGTEDKIDGPCVTNSQQEALQHADDGIELLNITRDSSGGSIHGEEDTDSETSPAHEPDSQDNEISEDGNVQHRKSEDGGRCAAGCARWAVVVKAIFLALANLLFLCTRK